FPGESEAALQNLLEFLDEVRFDRLGVFTYSPEDGTPSPGFPDQVPAEVAAERAAIVQDLQDRIAWERNQTLVGAVTDVLVDGPSQDPAFAFEGRTAGQAPEIDGVVYLRGGRFEPGRDVGGASGRAWPRQERPGSDRHRRGGGDDALGARVPAHASHARHRVPPVPALRHCQAVPSPREPARSRRTRRHG